MKISELIEELQSTINIEGDIDITWSNECYINDLDHLNTIASVRMDEDGKHLDIITC